MSKNENGYLENKKNIYYYDTIYPLSNIREKKTLTSQRRRDIHIGKLLLVILVRSLVS